MPIFWNSITSAYTYEYGGQPFEANSCLVTNKPHYLKPQWFHAMPDGTIVVENESKNGFNDANLALINKNTIYGAMPMVKGDYWDVSDKTITTWIDSIDTPIKRSNQVKYLTELIIKYDFFGIEIDYEPASIEATRSDGQTAITKQDITNKYLFLTELATAIHNLQPKVVNNTPIKRKLSVAVAAQTELTLTHNYQMINYAKLVLTGVDYIMIMNYDWWYSEDIYDGQSKGNRSSAPTQEFQDTINYCLKTIPLDKIVMGIPDYGYHGKHGQDIEEGKIIRLGDAKKLPNFNTGIHVANTITFKNPSNKFRGGSELWFDTGYDIAHIPTSTTMNIKRDLCEKYGIKQVSIWAFAGTSACPTPWFSGKVENHTARL